MWRLAKFLGLATLLWSGWWWLGVDGMDTGLRYWLDERRAEGWVAEASSLKVSGYPDRFEAAFEGLELADPETGLAWSAPGFHLISRAWNPTDFTAIWPTEQRISTPFEKLDISATGMQARLSMLPGPALTLLGATADLDQAALTSSRGWRAQVAEAQLVLDRIDAALHRYDLRFTAASIEPTRAILTLIDPGRRLPQTIGLVSVDATMGFDAPWDRYAIEQRRPQPNMIDLRRLKASWGTLDLEAAGDVTVDAEGVPEGRIHLRAVNWREMLALAEANGTIPPEIIPTLTSALGMMAQATGNAETLDIALSLQGGRIWLGPIPLGPAPRLTIR